MARVAAIVPAESDILCERCGYVLSGLPEPGRCPECGRPIAESLGGRRRPSAFEVAPSIRSFLRTSFAALVRPRRFYRSLATRYAGGQALWFARCHWGVAALLFSLAACGQVCVVSSLREGARAFLRTVFEAFIPGEPVRTMPPRFILDEPGLFWLLFVPVAAIVYLLITMMTRLAARLGTAKAAHAGIRLPLAVARRGLYFHSVHYVPVAFLAAMAVLGFIGLLNAEWLGLGPLFKSLGLDALLSDSWRRNAYLLYQRVHLRVVSGVTALCFAYLFIIYRIAMRNMMYANN